MTSVKDILKIPKLMRLKVVAGEKGLDKNVMHATVMEVPDIIKWLKGDDLLITSLYSIKDDIQKQCNLIKDLSNSGCSGIAVKVGEHVKKISDELKKTANEYNLPLIEVPYDITYIDIIICVMNLVFEERESESILQKYIKNIIFDIYEDEKSMGEKGRLLGIDVDKDYFLALTLSLKGQKEIEESHVNSLKRIAKTIFKNVSCGKNFELSTYIETEKGVSVILKSNLKENIEKVLPCIGKEVLTHGEYYLRDKNLVVGIGTIETSIEGIKKSYFNSVRAIEAGEVFKEEKKVFYYKDMEIYCILNEVIGECTESLINLVLKNVNNEELLNTLEKYYECNANLDETAAKLFVHKNTVKYRLQKIKDITGLDLKIHEDSFKLYLAVLANKILLNSTKK